MENQRAYTLFWNCTSQFELDERLVHHIRHEVDRLAQLCGKERHDKNQFLINLQQPDEKSYRTNLTCRHG